MAALSVTVVTSMYGSLAHRFFEGWWKYVQRLDPAPDRVIVATDNGWSIDGAADMVVTRCPWRHPQAWHQNQALRLVDTDWVWLVDIDDHAKPDALAGLDDVRADVWLMGFERSDDGFTYIPPKLTNDEYLAGDGNPYPAGSAIRTEAVCALGGFLDVAFQDWSLWRRLAAAGYEFEVSGRIHYTYQRHPYTRSELELTPDTRERNVAEMLSLEGVGVAA